MDTTPDRQPTCGFCDGSGLWADADGDPAAADPCPLCNGAGVVPGCGPGEEAPPADAVTMTRLQALLPRLSQAERQHLYEELHARYDCRIYR